MECHHWISVCAWAGARRTQCGGQAKAELEFHCNVSCCGPAKRRDCTGEFVTGLDKPAARGKRVSHDPCREGPWPQAVLHCGNIFLQPGLHSFG
jgi:hypothetical protein